MNGPRAENVKNGRSHKIVLEGDLATRFSAGRTSRLLGGGGRSWLLPGVCDGLLIVGRPLM